MAVGRAWVRGITTALVVAPLGVASYAPAGASDRPHGVAYETRIDEPISFDALAMTELDPALTREVSLVSGGGHGTATLDGSTVTYTPDPGFTGVDTVAVSVHSEGTAVSGIDVRVTDQPVIAADDHLLVDPGQPVTLDVGANDSTTSGQPLRYTLYSVSGGTASCSGPVCTWTPSPGTHGNGGLQYDAWDDSDGEHDTGFVTFDARDLAPVAVDDDVEVHRGQSVTLSPLDNDSDPDGEALTLVRSIEDPLTCPTATTCTVSTASDEQWTEPHVYSYVATDGLLRDTGTITLTMPANDNEPPTVSDTGERAVLGTRPAPLDLNVLDPNQDTVTQTPLTQPVDGTLSHDAAGWWYTADANASGTDGFTMRLTDGHGGVTDVPIHLTRTRYTLPTVRPTWPVASPVYVGEVVGMVAPYTSQHNTDGDPPIRLQALTSGTWENVASAEEFHLASASGLRASWATDTPGASALRLKVGPRWGAAATYTPATPLKVLQARIRNVVPTGRESFTVRNTGSVAFNLMAFHPSAYHLSRPGNGTSFALPSFSLPAGSSVVVHTASGTSTRTDLYLGVGRVLPDTAGGLKLWLGRLGPTATW